MPEPNQPSPTNPSDRIRCLDVIRGVAVLGILLINIQWFAYPDETLLNPNLFGNFTGFDYATWTLIHIFAERKFFSLFTIIFGASLMLFTSKQGLEGREALKLHSRRIFWLLIIGCLHATLLWNGDILLSYALSAAIVVWFRNWSAQNQLLVGMGVVSMMSFRELSMATQGLELAWWSLSDSAIQSDLMVHRSGWVELVSHRTPSALEAQLTNYLSSRGWYITGMMLVGMGLYQSGFLTGRLTKRRYQQLAVVAGVLGVSVTGIGILYIEFHSWDAAYGYYWRAFNFWGSILVAIAYLAGIIAYTSESGPSGIQYKLESVGQTALSNYLFQSLVGTTIFYGYGLELYGSVTRAGQLLLVLLIWAIQIYITVRWLDRYKYGPAEWVWRSLIYQSVQPLRKDN